MNRETSRKKLALVDWSELPKELLEKISGGLIGLSGPDYLTFRKVCRKWRDSCPPPTNLFFPGFPLEIPTYLGREVVLFPSFIYVLRLPLHKCNPTTTSWIVQVDEFNPGKLQVRNPVTNNRLYVDNFPETLNFNDYSSLPYAISYNLRLSTGNDDVFDSRCYPWRDYPVKTKSILLECGMVVVLSLGQVGMLGILKVNGDWKFTDFGYNGRFDDIEVFKEHICVLTRFGKSFLINGADGKLISLISKPLSKSYVGDRRKLLTAYGDDLYMIARGECEFKVFKLNGKLQQWERVNSLGDKILFVSYDKCFLLDADYLPVFERNCILFPKNCFPNNSGDYSVDGELFQGATRHLEIDVSSENNGTSIPAIDSPLQITQDNSLLEKFQGADVSSNLVPVRSNDLLTWALESLAKMVIILQKNTGESLDDSQAEYLKLSLVDLQTLHFRLDWMVPFVERALAIHKSKCQKIIVTDLEKRKSKLLAELHELEQMEKTLAGSLIISTAPPILKKGLAEGLF
ncbi:hypothetical protein SOVF_145930 [Spinacia oleracea]|nr:hypothetical protein SOVF_145930 [Spinacia oleracea]